jgi:hypothetical protein
MSGSERRTVGAQNGRINFFYSGRVVVQVHQGERLHINSFAYFFGAFCVNFRGFAEQRRAMDEKIRATISRQVAARIPA